MKKIVVVLFVIAAGFGLVAARVKQKTVGAQSAFWTQGSYQAVVCNGSTVWAGQPIVIGANGNLTCVLPQSGTGAASALALTNMDTNRNVFVLPAGIAMAVFSNQPVSNDIALLVNGAFVDSGVTTLNTISGAQGVGGKIRLTTNPDGTPIACPTGYTYCAMVNFTPISYGNQIVETQFANSVKTYVATNSAVTSVNGSVGAVTIPGAASITGVRYGNGASADTAATSSQVQTAIGAGVYDASGAAATAQTNAQTFASNAANITSGTLNAARLPTLSTTVNGQTCTIGSTCTIAAITSPNTVWYNSGTIISGQNAAGSGTVRCATQTATTSAGGTFAFNPSTMVGGGTYTTLLVAQPTVNLATAGPATVNITGTPSTTSVNVYATGGSAVTILSINLIAFNASALPVTLLACVK